MKKGDSDDDWDKVNSEAVTTLLSVVDSSQAQHINHLDKALGQWKVLKVIHEASSGQPPSSLLWLASWETGLLVRRPPT